MAADASAGAPGGAGRGGGACGAVGWGDVRGGGPSGLRVPSVAPTVLLPELLSLLAAGRARLVVVRSREEVAAGTIPGTLHILGSGLGGGARRLLNPGVLAGGLLWGARRGSGCGVLPFLSAPIPAALPGRGCLEAGAAAER